MMGGDGTILKKIHKTELICTESKNNKFLFNKMGFSILFFILTNGKFLY